MTNSTKPLSKNAMPMYSNVLYIVYPFVCLYWDNITPVILCQRSVVRHIVAPLLVILNSHITNRGPVIVCIYIIIGCALFVKFACPFLALIGPLSFTYYKRAMFLGIVCYIKVFIFIHSISFLFVISGIISYPRLNVKC
jgi:hypothetical protein